MALLKCSSHLNEFFFHGFEFFQLLLHSLHHVLSLVNWTNGAKASSRKIESDKKQGTSVRY